MDLIIILSAKYLFLLPVAFFVVYFMILSPLLKKRFVVFSIFSFTFSFVLTKILGLLIYNPRPFVTEQIKPLIKHAADNGFPSDHTVLTATIAILIFFYNRKLGLILGFIALLVGTSRVLAGIHHPIDILGAFLIALTAVAVTRFGLRKLFR